MKRVLFASAALLLTAAPLAAAAEDWTVDGKLGASVATTDNALASANNEKSDTVWGVAGDITASTKGDGGSFSVFANFDLTRYSDFDDENTDDYGFGANGSIKVGEASSLFAGASHALTSEDRHKVTARRDTRKPTESTVDSFDAGLKTRLGGLGFSARVDYVTSDYEDARTRVGNLLVDQDFRDRGTWTETFRVTGSPDADVSWFGQVSFTQVDYDLAPPAVLHNRDSDGYKASVGVSFDVTDQITGEASVGWAGRSFDSPTFDDVTDLVVDADLTWTVSDSTRITLSAARGFEETTVALSPIYVATALGFRIDHDVTSNFALAAYLEQEWDDHENRDRKDTTGKAGVSAAWKIAPNVEMTGAYDFSTQDSDGIHAIPGYDDGRFSLGLSIGF